MAYRSIADYGLIGDCRTAALVSSDGSIDWLCAPDFDSPALFARLLDVRRGGYFSIQPAGAFESRTEYIEESAVLRTTFRTPSGSATLTDFMPPASGQGADAPAVRSVMRILEGVQGDVALLVDCRPRPDYGARAAAVAAAPHGVRIDLGAGEPLALRSSVPLGAAGDRAAAELVLRAGDKAWLALDLCGQTAVLPAEALAETLEFWRDWHRACRYGGPYRDAVLRALLGLKLLMYAPTGAMVAAPTTSLPEAIGGVRNWDYRHTWIRDASFAAHALYHAGHPEDMRRFMRWTCDTALRCEPGELQIMYGIRGERELAERTLDHLEGYRVSRPVRVGNAASGQFQLDVYGELLHCFDVFRRCELRPEETRDMWPAFRGQVEAVARRWREPDSSLWEMRSTPRHFVHSKAMAWVALDRGIAAVEQAGMPGDVAQWRHERDAVCEQIMRCGYDAQLGFVQHYGSRRPDAANLLLPLFRFVAAPDPRMRATIETIRRRLVREGVVYRYLETDDGLPGTEATFAPCSFWLVENLVAMGEREEAARLFESLLARATPLGLFAEELEPQGEQLGNFPQALALLALVNAALALDSPGSGQPGRTGRLSR